MLVIVDDEPLAALHNGPQQPFARLYAYLPNPLPETVPGLGGEDLICLIPEMDGARLCPPPVPLTVG